MTSGLLVPWVSSDPSVDPLFGSFAPELAGSWSLAASSVPSAGLSATWGSHLVCKEEEVPLVVDNLPVIDMKMASDSHPAHTAQDTVLYNAAAFAAVVAAVAYVAVAAAAFSSSSPACIVPVSFQVQLSAFPAELQVAAVV